MVYCLVTRDGSALYPWLTFSDACLKYQFDLERRQVYLEQGKMPFRPNETHFNAAWNYFNENFGTAEKLMEFSRIGYLDKLQLSRLLKEEKRQTYLDGCAGLEREFTRRCGESGDPCLADGCAFEKTGEVCLNAVLLHKTEYFARCAAIWEEFFKDPENRMEAWKNR